MGTRPKKDLNALHTEIFNGSDRSCVVMFGAFVEISLARFLKHGIRKSMHDEIFNYTGPLGTFSSKIAMAYALSLIGPKTHNDLIKIRHLRNQFAHSRKPIKFRTPVVKRVCDLFTYPDMAGVHIPFDFLDKVSRARLRSAGDKTNPRTRFIITCYEISYRMLEARGEGISPPGTTEMP